MDRVLIVDDSREDRRSLRRLVQKALPGVEPAEAENIREMYAQLARECGILFQDIALEPREGVHDSQGLAAIYDVVDSYPGLPVVVVTGHLVEKAEEIIHGVLDCRSVVAVLNKATYAKADVLQAVEKAAQFRRDWEEEQGKPDFVDQVFADAERRFEEYKREYEAQREADASRAHLYRKALTGADWVERARAETEVSNGACTLTAMDLCRHIEARMRTLFAGDAEEGATFYKRLQWVQARHGLTEREFWRVNDAWTSRNAIVHARQPGRIGAVKELDAALRVLEGIPAP